MSNLKNYIRIARPDHWIKQMFVLPGTVFALAILREVPDLPMLGRIAAAFLATCFTASANYVINEWLDAKTDRFHPTKKYRPAAASQMKLSGVLLEYALLAAAGLLLARLVSLPVFLACLLLLIMGVLYNVRPMRTKDIPYLDVISESLNNAIRLMIGWFAVTKIYFPPVSIIFGYWMGGAFLMAMKRFAEYRMIGDPETAGKYRRSFRYYTERSLLISAFFYAMLSVFFCGTFLIKYRIELLLAVPLLCGLFCYYVRISFNRDSSAQKPEKLFREKGLMLYLLVFFLIVTVLMLVDIAPLQKLLDTELIPIG